MGTSSSHTMIDPGFETNLNFILPTTVTDCCLQQCENRRKQLMEENQRLLEKVFIIFVLLPQNIPCENWGRTRR